MSLYRRLFLAGPLGLLSAAALRAPGRILANENTSDAIAAAGAGVQPVPAEDSALALINAYRAAAGVASAQLHPALGHLHRLAVTLTCLTSLLAFGAVQPLPASAASDEVAQVVALTNAERQKAGLQPLRPNDQLGAAAQGYAVVLATGECWAHTCGPEPDFAKRAAIAGYMGWSGLAENIAAGQRTPEAVVRSWMNSEGHRKNILNPSFSEIGVGVASGGRMGIYWAQEFGARRDAPADRLQVQMPQGQVSQPVRPRTTPAPAPSTAGRQPAPAPAAPAPAAAPVASVSTAPEGVAEIPPAAALETAPVSAEAALAASLGMSTLELQSLNLINLDRMSRGVAPLTWDPQLAEVARGHAREMMETGSVGHSGADGSTPLERMRRGGVRVTWGGENVWTFRGRVPHEGPNTMHAAMMDEPHEPGLWNHIANILLPTYKRVGIGIVVSERGVQYLVENFAD